MEDQTLIFGDIGAGAREINEDLRREHLLSVLKENPAKVFFINVHWIVFRKLANRRNTPLPPYRLAVIQAICLNGVATQPLLCLRQGLFPDFENTLRGLNNGDIIQTKRILKEPTATDIFQYIRDEVLEMCRRNGVVIGPRRSRLIIVLDEFSGHKTRGLRNWFRSENIFPLLLPTYSHVEHMPLERLVFFMKRHQQNLINRLHIRFMNSRQVAESLIYWTIKYLDPRHVFRACEDSGWPDQLICALPVKKIKPFSGV